MTEAMGRVASAEDVDAFLAACDAGSRYQGVPLPHGRRLPGMDLSPLANVVFKNGVGEKSVLDVGCHHGYFLLEAVSRGATRVVGVEPNDHRRSIAQQVSALHGNVYSVVDGHTHDLPEGSFDVVLLLSVIHHIQDPVADLANLAQAANEMVVVEVPEPSDPALLHRLTGARGPRTNAKRLVDYPRRAMLQRKIRRLGRQVPLAVAPPHRGLYLSRGAFLNLFVVRNRIFSDVEFVPSPLRPERFIAFCVPQRGGAPRVTNRR